MGPSHNHDYDYGTSLQVDPRKESWDSPPFLWVKTRVPEFLLSGSGVGSVVILLLWVEPKGRTKFY